jgi:hypothetical protein
MPFAVSRTTRTVAAAPAAVRAALVRTLRDMQFEVTAEQVTLVEARRGSQIGAAALQRQRLPLLVSARLRDDDASCVLDFQLSDGWHSATGRALGLQGSYAELFGEILRGIDAALRGLDPTQAAGPAALRAGPAGPAGDVGLLDRLNSRPAGGGLSRVEGWLEGRKASAPEAWRGVGGIRLVSSKGQADLPLARVQTMLTVALLVSRSPGSMPEKLAKDVEQLAARLERELGMPGAGGPRVEITDAELPVVTFLSEQARIRESLPLRTLQRCTTCRHERVVNPDYKRLVERNRKIRGVSGALGASLSSHGASPFFLVGRLLPLAKLDPEYVCPRCQGLESDDRVIVFCPNCGERRDEAVLKTCRRCSHSFRGALEPEALWHEPAPEPVLAPSQGPPLLLPPGTAHYAPPSGPPVGHVPPRPAAWLPDPSGRHEARWWDGFRWTDQVLDRGLRSRDVPR